MARRAMSLLHGPRFCYVPGIKQLSALLLKLSNRWSLGFALGVGLGTSLLLIGGASYFVVAGLLLLLTVSEAGLWDWFLFSGLLWVPLALGIVGHGAIEIVGPSVRARRELERADALAPYLNAAPRG